MAKPKQEALSIWKRLLVAIGITFVIGLLSAWALSKHFFEDFENRTWDLRLQNTSGTISPHPKIKIITIDQKSLEFAASELGVRWLWPRDMYEPILFFLKEAKAKAVAFDILFTESTEHSYELDVSFANAVNSSLPVVSAVVLSNAAPPESPEAVEAFAKLIEKHRDDVVPQDSDRLLKAFPAYQKVTLPYLELINASSMLASVKGEGDSDGVFRRVEIGGMWQHDQGKLPVPNLPFALYEAAFGDLKSKLVEIEERIDEEGKLPLQFLGPEGTIPTYSFASILTSYSRLQEGLTPSVKPEEFRDALVFVGMTAPGLKDLRPTPLAKEFPGVELNATVLDNFLLNRFVQKTSMLVNLLVVAFLTFIVAVISLFASTSFTGVLNSTLVGLTFVAATFALAFQGIWVTFFVPIIAMILSLSSSLAAQYHFEGRRRAFLRLRPTIRPEVVHVSDYAFIRQAHFKKCLSDMRSIKLFNQVSHRIEQNLRVADSILMFAIKDPVLHPIPLIVDIKERL